MRACQGFYVCRLTNRAPSTVTCLVTNQVVSSRVWILTSLFSLDTITRESRKALVFCLLDVAFVMMFSTPVYNRPQNSILTVGWRGKNLIRSLWAGVARGRGRRGKKRKLGREGRYSLSRSSPPSLSSLPLFGACFACKKLMKFHGSMLLCLKLQLKLIMVKFVINSCAVLWS